MTKIKRFISRNLVTIVMIPSLFGLHWAWNSLQHNTALVSESERRDLPIAIAAKAFWERVDSKADLGQEK